MYRSDGYMVKTNDAIYHHLYEFGTTGIFVPMGQPVKKLVKNGEMVDTKPETAVHDPNVKVKNPKWILK